MPEICLLCEYATLNGGERSMLATLGGVRAAGFSPVIIGPPEGPLAETIASLGIELLPFTCRGPDETRPPQSLLREQLSGILHRRRPSLLARQQPVHGPTGGPCGGRVGTGKLAHLRDIVKLSAQAAADVNRHSRFLAVSHATRDFHVANGLEPEKIHVLYNGVDLADFQPRPPTGYVHRELGLPADVRLIGTIGQIGLRKGQDVLLRAAIASPIARPTLITSSLASGSEKDESRRFEQALHDAVQGSRTGRVHFLGTRRDMCRLLNELTLLVHPARQEPLGRVLLEAAAAGVPVIATNVGGTSEIFPPESHAAQLVPADDDRALADAILELLGDAEQRNRMAIAARARAEEQFDSRMAVANLLAHYRALVLSASCH